MNRRKRKKRNRERERENNKTKDLYIDKRVIANPSINPNSSLKDYMETLVDKSIEAEILKSQHMLASKARRKGYTTSSSYGLGILIRDVSRIGSLHMSDCEYEIVNDQNKRLSNDPKTSNGFVASKDHADVDLRRNHYRDSGYKYYSGNVLKWEAYERAYTWFLR
jgi:hypothetical protein